MSAENLPSQWVNIRLKELLLIPSRNGIYKPKEFHGKGVKIVNMGEMFSYNRIGNQHMKRLELNENEKRNYLLENGDLLFARRSLTAEGAGKCSIVQDLSEPTTFESSIIRLRPDPKLVNSVFLFNFFKSPQGVYQIGTILRQVAVSGITSTDLVELEITLPPLIIQRRIAAILTALDDKIELNRRMNETLEGIAQAVWGEWFGKYARGEEELPEGWRWGKLGEVAQTKKGQIRPDEMTDDLQYVGLEHITRKSLSLTDSSTAGKLESNKFRFSKGDLLFGKLRPYFHKVCIAPFDGVCSTDILVIEPKTPEWFAFVIFHFYSDELIAFTTSTADGTRMPRTNWGDLAGFEIAIPPKELALAFNELAKPIFDKMIENITQLHTLTALRDALLPQLMRGEINFN